MRIYQGVFGKFHTLMFVVVFQWLTASYAVFYLVAPDRWESKNFFPRFAIVWNLAGAVLLIPCHGWVGLPWTNVAMLMVFVLGTAAVQMSALGVKVAKKSFYRDDDPFPESLWRSDEVCGTDRTVATLFVLCGS